MSIKKAELHTHLEGTIPPDLARTLAMRNNMKIPEGLIAPDNRSYLSKDFMDFLKAYDALASLIKTPEDYYSITFDYLKAGAAVNTIYTEMMYSPDHAESHGIPSREHLAAIQQAIDDAESKFGIVGRIIVTAVRHLGVDAAIRIAKQAEKDSFRCVTGFGLGGDEAGYPPKLFETPYKIAKNAGLFCTVHAGEMAPAEGMLEAIKYLPIQRIGHGVNAIYSPETMDILKEKDIALEVCPSSNIFLGLFKNMEEHPFPKFLEYGLKISINSDDPPFMSTTIGEEYERVQKAYNYDDTTMNRITAMAIEAAFVDQETKKRLLDLI